MTPEEKLYNELKNWFIAKHGNKFLRLSEENQNKKIIELIQLYREKMKLDIE